MIKNYVRASVANKLALYGYSSFVVAFGGFYSGSDLGGLSEPIRPESFYPTLNMILYTGALSLMISEFAVGTLRSYYRAKEQISKVGSEPTLNTLKNRDVSYCKRAGLRMALKESQRLEHLLSSQPSKTI